MAEEEEGDGKTHQNEKDNEPFDYNQVDPLAAIGYSAEPGDIYYINPPQELSTYPMYIENPQKIEKKVGTSYISYTLNGTDITEQMSRRYSDFFALYEKLLVRWPGVYVPRIPPKKLTKNTSRKMIKNRMRLLNRFCLNLSNIDYLYSSDETSLFKGNTPDLANAITKLPDLSPEDYLAKLKDAFPQYNENYDILIGKGKINEFDIFLKKSLKNIEVFQKSVESAAEKREHEKKKYVELMNGLVDYEKNGIISYVEDNNSLIFNNPSYSELAEKVNKLKDEMINPYTAFKEWLEEEVLDAEAMSIAIKGINELIEKEDKYRQKLESIESELKKLEGGGSSLKTLFKKKGDVISSKQKEKEETQEKLDTMSLIVRIVADNMENQIEEFKNLKTQTYYKYLKIFAILQRESNRVIRELWTLVKNALNEIAPNAAQANEDYVTQPISNDPNEDEQMDADGED